MMKENILIVEDEFIVANDLRIILEKAGYQISGIAPSFSKAMALVEKKRPDWVLVDIFLKGDKTGIDLGKELNEMNIPFIYVSANTNQSVLEAAKSTQPYGFLVKPFREKDLLVMLDIARYHHQQSLKLNKQRDNVFQKQVELIISEALNQEEKLKQMAFVLQALVPFDLISISKINNRNPSQETLLLKTKATYQVLKGEALPEMMAISARDAKLWQANDQNAEESMLLNGYDFKRMRINNEWLKQLSNHFTLESALYFILNGLPEDYRISFYSSQPEIFSTEHLDLLLLMQGTFRSIITHIIEIPSAPEKTVFKKQEETAIVKEEIPNFHGIIGQNPLLKALFSRIELVSPADISVLILGESGTGKERIAHTIHKLSPRKSKPLVIVNCGALPVNLIESELFGHEKGAFTGASDKRIGKFEQADCGTIFLDEIGELPLDAQVKLLRVLQEKEIERLGGSYTKKINVRIITATNRNLEKEVAEGRFRLDLYYRLNVFPISLPPLRERKDDISLLACFFLDKYSKKLKRNICKIAAEVMDKLLSYDWPGNIRELEHLIEKSVVLCTGDEITQIEMPLEFPEKEIPLPENSEIKTMEEMERDHIMRILSLCKGKIFGPGGAAEVLNIPSTTLNSKIKKLGIKYEFVKF